MHQTTLHAHRTLALAAAVAALVLVTGSSTAMAQDHVYFLSYFSNVHKPGAPDGTLRLTNDGHQRSGIDPAAGDLCASIYVFNNREEMEECCSCPVTPDGYLSLSVNTSLTDNPLTPETFSGRGLIEVVSSLPVAGACNPVVSTPKPGIHAWITHPEALDASGRFALSVEQLTDSNLGSEEAADLAETCESMYSLTVCAPCSCSCTDAGR
jgi:hypothetical protein